MISMKDIPVYLSLAGTIFGGGVYINDLRRDVAELGQDYRQHVVSGQRTDLLKEKYVLEDRLKKYPEDADTRNRLSEVEDELEVNKATQQQLKGTK